LPGARVRASRPPVERVAVLAGAGRDGARAAAVVAGVGAGAADGEGVGSRAAVGNERAALRGGGVGTERGGAAGPAFFGEGAGPPPQEYRAQQQITELTPFSPRIFSSTHSGCRTKTIP